MPQPVTPADENPVAKAFRVWSATCPFVSRRTMMTVVGTWLLSWFMPQLDVALRNQPFFTIGKYEVYRLVTSVFCSGGLLSMIFALMSFNQMGPKLERSLSSTGLLALMGTLTIVTNVAFVILCYLLSFLGHSYSVFLYASGFWNLLISLIVIECMATPDTPRRFFILPYDIPSKYYPLFLLLLFGFMRGNFLDLGCAVGVGYAYADGRLDVLKVSRSRLAAWESGCLSNFVQQEGYIISGAAMGTEAFSTAINNPSDHPSNQRNQSGGGGGFSSFFGRGGGEEGGGPAGGQGGRGESGFGSNNVIKRGGNEGSERRESFGGSGQTLGSGGGGATRSSGRSQTQHDPETARLARLAALEGRGAGGGGQGQRGHDEAATPLMEANDDDVLTLQDMGFTASEAREALQFTNGDVEAAASYLAA